MVSAHSTMTDISPSHWTVEIKIKGINAFSMEQNLRRSHMVKNAKKALEIL
jgi:hypothetical protein